MNDVELLIAEYREEYELWKEEHEIVEYVSLDDADLKKLEAMDPHLIWTSHGTCEDGMVSNGLQLLGDIPQTGKISTGCGCWQTYGFYIAKEPWPGDENTYISYKEEFHSQCPVCNEDGESEPNPDCEECEGEGFKTYWFD